MLVGLLVCSVTSSGLLWYMNVVKGAELDAYSATVASLQSRLDAVGTFTDVYTVKAPVLEGAVVLSEDDFVLQTIPTSVVPANAITNPKDVIGQAYRLSFKPGVTLTSDYFMSDNYLNHTYERDISLKSLPVGTKVGDYLDIRIILPYGEPYIALPHLRVNAIYDNTIKVVLDEAELALYSSLKIDYALYKSIGLTLEATKYTHPGTHDDTKPFYPVRSEIEPVVVLNPNIVNKDRCINKDLRKTIDAKLKVYGDELNSDDTGKLVEGVADEEGAQNAAQDIYKDYLQDMNEGAGTSGLIDPNGTQGSIESEDLDGNGDAGSISPETELDVKGDNILDDELVIE